MSGDVALMDSGDGAIVRLVRTASTLFASPDFRPAALVGGLAVTVRLASVHRAANDVDTVSEGEGPRNLALQYLGDADAAAANRIEIDGVRVDVMPTWPLPTSSDELPEADLDRLFVLGHRWALDIGTELTVDEHSDGAFPMARFRPGVQDVAMEGNSGVPAGWYDDPWTEAVLRWWDGSAWTGHVENPGAPPATPRSESSVARLLVEGGRIAVVDVETTGVYNSDRVVEIAIVTLDEHGVVVDEFETLVNPGRDVGPTWIHQVTASMVSDAPSFGEVADYVAARLDGAVIAAHNLPFDRRMLNNELLRCGINVDWGGGLDTLSVTGCKLSVACGEFGIINGEAHSALGDARATAQLLLAVTGEFESGCGVVTARPIDLTATIRVITRDGKANATVPAPYLASLARGARSYLDVAPYVDLLDQAIGDLRLTDDERTELAALAAELGLDESRVVRAHRDFLNGMIDAALEDSVVTTEECELLQRAAALLEVDVELVDRRTMKFRVSTSELLLMPGLTVCFTGAATNGSGGEIDRAHLEGLAVEAGLTPTRSVTREGCNLLVAADPATESGKAAKARKYGLPISSVDDFLAALKTSSPLTVSSVSTAVIALVCSKCGDSWLSKRSSARPICAGCRSSATHNAAN